jgi:hypothetical protein
MHGQCKINAYEGCAPAPGVSSLSSRILLAVLGVMVLLLCGLLFFLRKFHTGVYANPWSVAGVASLASNRDVRPQQDSERRIEKEMAEKRYGFGFFENRAGQTEYGIVLYDDAGENLQHNHPLSESSSVDAQAVSRGRRNPFVVLGLAWRLVFLLFLLGLMVFLLYYHLTLDKSSSFKNFMNSQTFGVRFLFAAFGVIISFSWTAFFISKFPRDIAFELRLIIYSYRYGCAISGHVAWPSVSIQLGFAHETYQPFFRLLVCLQAWANLPWPSCANGHIF